MRCGEVLFAASFNFVVFWRYVNQCFLRTGHFIPLVFSMVEVFAASWRVAIELLLGRLNSVELMEVAPIPA